MADIAASVLAKLKNKSKTSGIGYQQCLQLFFQEEFLRKLAGSKYSENFILKGGLFIYTLTNFESRATVDVDFLMRGLNNDLNRMDEIIAEILAVPTGNDFVTFKASKTNPIAVQRKYHGVSTQITGYIKNVRVPFNVDIGVGDIIVPHYRCCQSTMYEKAMGSYVLDQELDSQLTNYEEKHIGNVEWWLSDTVFDPYACAYIGEWHGKTTAKYIVSAAYSVRPVVTLDLTATEQYSNKTGYSAYSPNQVTWDTVWFGSYPQAEVITAAMNSNYTALDARLLEDGDLLVSDSLYAALQAASGWDANNEITLDGAKYRRMKKGDASRIDEYNEGDYNWSDATTWHYFKYEPIKWRVLQTNGSQATLLADVALTSSNYHSVDENVTWETCTLRSWLNQDFFSEAFNAREQSAVVNTLLENPDNITYGTESGNNTTDKVFLLSESEVWNTEKAKAFGLAENYYARIVRSSTYARAMGTYDGYWVLRTPGNTQKVVTYIWNNLVLEYGGYVIYPSCGIRPALTLDLSSTQYSYAGTICTDGTVEEIAYVEKPQTITVNFHANGGSCATSSKSITCGSTYGILPTPTRSGYTFLGWYTAASGGTRIESDTVVTATEDQTLYAQWKVKLVAPTMSFASSSVTKTVGDASFKNALTCNSSGSITYTSSNTSVATVNSSGQVTIVGEGSCMITATVAASQTYTAGSTFYNLTVLPKEETGGGTEGGNGGETEGGNGGNGGSGGTTLTAPTLSFANTVINKIYGAGSFRNTLTTNSEGALSYQSSNTAVATVDKDGFITITGEGSCIISVTVAAYGNYSAGSAAYVLNVSPIPEAAIAPMVEFSNISLTKVLGDESFVNEMITDSYGNVTYKSSNTNVATVDADGRVTIHGTGTCTITATIEAAGDYTSGSNSYTLTVLASAQTGNGGSQSGGTTTTTPTTPGVTTTLQTGTVVTNVAGGASYQVTGLTEMMYLLAPASNASTITVPDTVVVNGKTYAVTSIAAKAFKGNKKLKKIVIGKNIKKIGKQAFKGIYAKAKIKVPKAKKNAYKKIPLARGVGKKAKIS